MTSSTLLVGCKFIKIIIILDTSDVLRFFEEISHYEDGGIKKGWGGLD